MAHLYPTTLAGAFGNRCNSCQHPKGMVVSSSKGLRSLGEQCGENNPTDSWQGA